MDQNKMKVIAETYKDLFSCDDVHEEYCRKCGKKWIHAELSPGEFAFYDKEGDIAEEWAIENDKEFKNVHFHICSCNFPLLIDNHYDEKWETYMPEQMFKASEIETWGIEVKK
jgi:hypothetical protein